MYLVRLVMPPLHGGSLSDTAIRPSVCLSVCLYPRRSCLGCRHAGCLQLSHRRPPAMCVPRTRPQTDVDPPRLCHRRTAISGAGAYRLAASGVSLFQFVCCRRGFNIEYCARWSATKRRRALHRRPLSHGAARVEPSVHRVGLI